MRYKILIGIVISVILAGAGFFWFQQSNTSNHTPLTPQNNAVAILRTVERGDQTLTEPELTISAEPHALAENPLAVSLDMLSLEEFAEGSTRAGNWTARARDSLPRDLIPASPLYVIAVDSGAIMPELTLTLNPAIPADSLDMYGWYPDSQTWRFIPYTFHQGRQTLTAQTDQPPAGLMLLRHAPDQMAVVARLNFNQTIAPAQQAVITIASPIGMMPILPAQDGQTLYGNPATGFETTRGYRVMPLISNRTATPTPDLSAIIPLLADDSLRRDHVRQIATFAHAGNYAGVFIDYHAIPADSHGLFEQFLRELKRALSETGGQLGVIVPLPQAIGDGWDTMGYDWQALGAIVDYLQFEASLNPLVFVAGGQGELEQLLRWAVQNVPRQKLIVSLTSQPIFEQNGIFAPTTYHEALRNLGRVRVINGVQNQTFPPEAEIQFNLDGMNVETGINHHINTPYLDYLNAAGEPSARVWLITPHALGLRLGRLLAYSIGGVHFSDLFQTDHSANLIAQINYFRTLSPASELPLDDIRLRWQIAGNSGMIGEAVTDFGEPLIVTLSAPDGNYSVSVGLANDQSPYDSVSIALAQPTATPTPLPYATSRPHPTPTPTLIPIYPTFAPPEMIVSGGQSLPPAVTHSALYGAPTSNPIMGSLSLSGFEYGGHVMDMASERAIPVMQQTGMMWMKVQIRFSPGASIDHAARQIQAAHAHGFKALIGIVGEPRDVAAGGQNYLREYAHFAAQIAHLGADAIEVWNEPNLGREWPSGSISGGNYTALLAETFNAVKASNPQTIVISGAPAPTGAQAAFPNDVVNDDTFLTQMVNAGALNYMDCLGVHYNEGILPPTATSGDPRGDNYYTRYLPRLLDRYRQIIGNQRPICITELGYLSPEGFGGLPNAFGWASGMTNANQAAYLAGALQYGAQSADIRMIIIWNIDFTRYDSDPMGGYAIIRPDGGCPACGAITGIR